LLYSKEFRRATGVVLLVCVGLGLLGWTLSAIPNRPSPPSYVPSNEPTKEVKAHVQAVIDSFNRNYKPETYSTPRPTPYPTSSTPSPLAETTTTPDSTPISSPTPDSTPTPTPTPSPKDTRVKKHAMHAVQPGEPQKNSPTFTQSEEDKVAQLVYNYMKATQNGKPVSLIPYVTNVLDFWYGQKNVKRERAEKENVDYYKHWPNQVTSFDASKITVNKVERKDHLTMYSVQLPFSYYISNSVENKSGNKVFNAFVILTTNGVGYRIISAENLG
jgi:hypothetical protein